MVKYEMLMGMRYTFIQFYADDLIGRCHINLSVSILMLEKPTMFRRIQL